MKRFVVRQASEIEEELKEVSYTVETSGAKLQIICPQQGKRFAPEEISAQVLRKLAKDAGTYMNAKINKAVITVPAYFNDLPRATRRGAQCQCLGYLGIFVLCLG